MVRYETLLLAVPEITSEETAKLENQFIKMVNAIKGNIISFEKWGKYRLAYPIRKNDYGVYFLTRFELPTEEKDKFFSDLKDLFAIKYHDIVMRHMVSALPATASLEYQRPRSLEEGPKDMDNLLKKGKDSDMSMMKESGLSEDIN
jgi:small subunit ribosomal protein S6